MRDTSAIRAIVTAPIFVASATTMVRWLRSIMRWLARASTGSCVVSPPDAEMPSTPMMVMPKFSPSRKRSVHAPTISKLSERNWPPVTMTRSRGRIVNSMAIVREFVTTVRPDRSTRWRATSRVVVPPLIAMAWTRRGIVSAHAAPIRCLASR